MNRLSDDLEKALVDFEEGLSITTDGTEVDPILLTKLEELGFIRNDDCWPGGYEIVEKGEEYLYRISPEAHVRKYMTGAPPGTVRKFLRPKDEEASRGEYIAEWSPEFWEEWPAEVRASEEL